MKRKMSRDVFRYIIEATDQQLDQMQLSVDDEVQQYWRRKPASNIVAKTGRRGRRSSARTRRPSNLRGSTNFKQLVPAAPSVSVNTTAPLAVFPDITYWIVINCQCNAFLCENFGWFRSRSRSLYYKDPWTAERIKKNMTECKEHWAAMSDFDGSRAS